jgi:hypothetical protein
MNKKETIDGYTFKLTGDGEFYECRGEICYDDEHDEVPEDGLWIAAHKLKEKLNNQGVNCEVEHSEKGWVEVVIY